VVNGDTQVFSVAHGLTSMSQIVSVTNFAKLPKVPGLRWVHTEDKQSVVLPVL